jgi:hypothetical protein
MSSVSSLLGLWIDEKRSIKIKHGVAGEINSRAFVYWCPRTGGYVGLMVHLQFGLGGNGCLRNVFIRRLWVILHLCCMLHGGLEAAATNPKNHRERETKKFFIMF